MKIYVRRRHIEKGVAKNACKCPIALAIGEALNGPTRVSITQIWFQGDYVNLPKMAQRFIERFDSGKPVKPFAFTIRA